MQYYLLHCCVCVCVRVCVRVCKHTYTQAHTYTHTHTHRDTVLPSRFPIGLEKLVRNFNAKDFKAFYTRHYYPANMCVYVTGDIDAADMEAKIHKVCDMRSCVCVCVCCVCCVCVCVCVRVRVHTCTKRLCPCLYTHAHTHTLTHSHTHTQCVYNMHIRIRPHAHTHTHILLLSHTHTHSLSHTGIRGPAGGPARRHAGQQPRPRRSQDADRTLAPPRATN